MGWGSTEYKATGKEVPWEEQMIESAHSSIITVLRKPLWEDRQGCHGSVWARPGSLSFSTIPLTVRRHFYFSKFPQCFSLCK